MDRLSFGETVQDLRRKNDGLLKILLSILILMFHLLILPRLKFMAKYRIPPLFAK